MALSITSATELVAQMTLEEKASLCSGQDFWHLKGIERLGLPPIMVTDGPHGLRKQDGSSDQLGIAHSVPATCFPPACATAASFDVELLRAVGAAIGEECQQEDVAVVLGPGANIKRSPLCGRNFEYYSEDPYLSGRMAAAFIEGVQGEGPGTSLKHFAANSQEKARFVSNSVVDMRALREIYLAGFEQAVRAAQPQTVMCSYNLINGVYACENEWLLTKLLRDEWGFDGLVMSDWGATDDRVACLAAGMELEMPASNGVNDAKIVAAVREGRLSEAVLDRAAERLVSLMLQWAQARKPGYHYDVDAHDALARRAAAESCVLLKNAFGLLPLQAGQRVAVIGAFAKTPRYQGAGSSKVNPTRITPPLDALLAAGVDAAYAPGYSLEPFAPPDDALIAEAVTLAKERDVVVLFAGLPDECESEGFDRDTLAMPAAHTKLIEAVVAASSNVVLVLMLGAPVVMDWPVQHLHTILLSYLGGQACGGGIADVLTGRVNPSGKLPESWPAALADIPCAAWYPGEGRSAEYRESIYVGYRYYETAKVTPAWPFGHGLSYTQFTYSDILPGIDVLDTAAPFTIQCTVSNTGPCVGAEVAQLYMGMKDPKVWRPARELKGFQKVFLQPGESRTLTFRLDARSFAYWNTAAGAWAVEGGTYTLSIGSSLWDIRLSADIQVAGDGLEDRLASLLQNTPTYAHPPAGPFSVGDAEFAALYGAPLPPGRRAPGTPYDRNSTLGEIQHTFIGRQFIKQIRKQAGHMLAGSGDGIRTMLEAMMMDMPLRGVAMMSGGAFTERRMDGMLDMLNGHPLRGLAGLLGSGRK